MTVDRQDFGEDFGEKLCGIDKARKEDKTEKVLTGPLLDPV